MHFFFFCVYWLCCSIFCSLSISRGEWSLLMKLSGSFLIASIENKKRKNARRKEKFSNSYLLTFTHHQDLIVFCFLLSCWSLKRLAICIENNWFVLSNGVLWIIYVRKTRTKESQFFCEKQVSQTINTTPRIQEEPLNKLLFRHSHNLTED